MEGKGNEFLLTPNLPQPQESRDRNWGTVRRHGSSPGVSGTKLKVSALLGIMGSQPLALAWGSAQSRWCLGEDNIVPLDL